VAASAPLATADLCYDDDRQLHSASRPLTFVRSHRLPGGPVGLRVPGALPGPTGYHHISLPLPRGEEEPVPEGAERGGYLPIPRRDARAGEWVFH